MVVGLNATSVLPFQGERALPLQLCREQAVFRTGNTRAASGMRRVVTLLAPWIVVTVDSGRVAGLVRPQGGD